LTTMLFSNQL